MRNKANCGFLNQKCWSLSCTSGIPWTTTCLSWISMAILAIIACSFIPIARIIYIIDEKVTNLIIWKRSISHARVLTTRGSIDAQNNSSHPEGSKESQIPNLCVGKYFATSDVLSPLTLRSKTITAEAHNTGLLIQRRNTWRT